MRIADNCARPLLKTKQWGSYSEDNRGRIHTQQNITHRANNKTKQPSTTINLRPRQIKNANPRNIDICTAQWTHRGRERHRQWEDVKVIRNKTCIRHRVIWGADANGELGNRNQEEEGIYANEERATQNIIGTYTRAEKTEKGNGAQLRTICRKQHAIPMATWKKPKIARRGKWKKQKRQEDMAKENWDRELHQNTPRRGQVQMGPQEGK